MPSDHKMLISRYLWYNGARTISEKGELSSSITEAHASASQAYGFSISESCPFSDVSSSRQKPRPVSVRFRHRTCESCMLRFIGSRTCHHPSSS